MRPNRYRSRLKLGGWGLLALMMVLSEASSSQAQMDDSRARELFEQGRGLFDQERYTECILIWRESYLLSHRPELLYNLAEAEERAERYGEAVISLEGYLASGVEHAVAHRQSIEQRIERLQELAARSPVPPPLVTPGAEPPPPPEPTEPATPVPVPEQPRPRPRIWTWVALGLTGAFGAGAAVTGALTLSRRNDLEERCGGTDCSSELQSDWDTAWALAITTDVLIGLASASAVATILLIFLENRSARSSRTVSVQAAFAPWISPGQAGITGTISF